jgi:hypothetical protein
MPLEPRLAEFNTFADRQAMSHFHLETHLKVVDLALDELFHRAFVDADDTVSYKTTMAREFCSTRERDSSR